MTIRFYFQFAVQFVHTLAHSGQAYARFCACFTKAIQTVRRYTASIITYFQNYRFKLVLKADANFRSSRMPVYIRQALLEDTEKRNLYPDWESLLSGCNIQLYVDPGSLGEALDVPLRCASKAGFIQQGWVQQVRHGANFFDGLIRQAGNLGGKSHSGRVLLAVFLKKRNTDFQSRQRLTSAVVQVTRQFASLFILHFEKPLREDLQFGGAL
jgi:hypothetical protein